MSDEEGVITTVRKIQALPLRQSYGFFLVVEEPRRNSVEAPRLLPSLHGLELERRQRCN